MSIQSHGLTDVGRRRGSNEDAFLIDTGHRLFAVADGMGGHAAGEVASRIAIETLQEAWSDTAAADVPREERLRGAVALANRRILDEVAANQELLGMGTTLVVAQIEGDDALIGHVGDSRTYLIRGGRLHLLTRDHSWVNEQVALGILAPADAWRHPHRNVITRALGGRDQVEADIGTETVAEGDLLILCSDGLNTMLADDEILQVAVEHGPSPEAIAQALVEAANAQGGADNVTVVVVALLPPASLPG